MHNFHRKCHYKSWNSLQLPSVIIFTCQIRTKLAKKGKTKALCLYMFARILKWLDRQKLSSITIVLDTPVAKERLN